MNAGYKDSYGTREAATIHEFERFSFRLDPLHLPRAPILRHNVSLCHGRATPLSLSPMPPPPPPLAPARALAETPAAASAVARSRVYGILDFGNSPPRTAQLNASRARSGPPSGRVMVFQHASPSGRVRGLEVSSSRFLNRHGECRDASSDESWKYCRFCHARRDTLP